jgi:L-alanine-DL-glutamate epimerase-like enolase superfamily enzyme
MYITDTHCRYERQPLKAPFAFKGRQITELWQTEVRLTDSHGRSAAGWGTQSVLWSDPAVFQRHTEFEANAIMFQTTERLAAAIRNQEWEGPQAIVRSMAPRAAEMAAALSGQPSVRLTFALNAMVGLDNAAWLLEAAQRGVTTFDELVPPVVRPVLAHRHNHLGLIPLIPYGSGLDEIRALLEEGSFLLKIKVGADPHGDGDPDAGLAWDMQRITEIHHLASGYRTPYTDSGHVLYYLDANGRYGSKAVLERLIRHLERIGAAERVVLIEEPFPEALLEDVHDIPLRVAADESVHSADDVRERLALGYRAFALKPIAKTLSMTFAMLAAAGSGGAHFFCADLTVNPILVEWNKNVAARLPPLPGLRVGVVEANGWQHYAHWEEMKRVHPMRHRPWVEARRFVFELDDEFYQKSGGIFAAGLGASP